MVPRDIEHDLLQLMKFAWDLMALVRVNLNPKMCILLQIPLLLEHFHVQHFWL
jgi:hypothetical protein